MIERGVIDLVVKHDAKGTPSRRSDADTLLRHQTHKLLRLNVCNSEKDHARGWCGVFQVYSRVFADGIRESLCSLMIFSKTINHNLQRHDPGCRQDTSLTHSPTKLLPNPMCFPDKCVRAAYDRSYRSTQALRKTKRD